MRRQTNNSEYLLWFLGHPRLFIAVIHFSYRANIPKKKNYKMGIASKRESDQEAEYQHNKLHTDLPGVNVEECNIQYGKC